MNKDEFAQNQSAITDKNILLAESQLRKQYRKLMKHIVADFESVYDKLLSEKENPTPADLYKLQRYWELFAQVRVKLQKMGETQINLLTSVLEKNYETVYKSIPLPQTFPTTLDTSVLKAVWCADGKTYSERIWENTEKLAQTLNDELVSCIATGKKTTELKNELRKRFNVSYSAVDCLTRTEMAHAQTLAAQQRYKDAGITEVEVWAEQDERKCDICARLHKKRFPIDEKPKVPVHPQCRCCILPVIGQES